MIACEHFLTFNEIKLTFKVKNRKRGINNDAEKKNITCFQRFNSVHAGILASMAVFVVIIKLSSVSWCL